VSSHDAWRHESTTDPCSSRSCSRRARPKARARCPRTQPLPRTRTVRAAHRRRHWSSRAAGAKSIGTREEDEGRRSSDGNPWPARSLARYSAHQQRSRLVCPRSAKLPTEGRRVCWRWQWRRGGRRCSSLSSSCIKRCLRLLGTALDPSELVSKFQLFIGGFFFSCSWNSLCSLHARSSVAY